MKDDSKYRIEAGLFTLTILDHVMSYNLDKLSEKSRELRGEITASVNNTIALIESGKLSDFDLLKFLELEVKHDTAFLKDLYRTENLSEALCRTLLAIYEKWYLNALANIPDIDNNQILTDCRKSIAKAARTNHNRRDELILSNLLVTLQICDRILPITQVVDFSTIVES